MTCFPPTAAFCDNILLKASYFRPPAELSPPGNFHNVDCIFTFFFFGFYRGCVCDGCSSCCRPCLQKVQTALCFSWNIPLYLTELGFFVCVRACVCQHFQHVSLQIFWPSCQISLASVVKWLCKYLAVPRFLVITVITTRRTLKYRKSPAEDHSLVENGGLWRLLWLLLKLVPTNWVKYGPNIGLNLPNSWPNTISQTVEFWHIVDQTLGVIIFDPIFGQTNPIRSNGFYPADGLWK